MKLKLVTLSAVALLGGNAMAQSTVTVYGVMDAGLLSISTVSAGTGYLPNTNSAGSVTQFKDGGIGASYLGFKGEEDLGSGYKATFQLQGNATTANGTMGGPNSSGGTSTFNQLATVGLAGGFGEVRMGRLVSPVFWAMASTDARQGRYFGSSLTGLVGLNSASGAFIGNNSNAAFGTVYNDNAVVYTSPKWSNVTIDLEYSLGGVAGSASANSQKAATARYDANGLKLSALYYSGNGNNASAATTIYTIGLGGNAAAAATAATNAGFTATANTNQLTSFGALYTWSAFTVSGAYFEARNPANAVLKGGSASLNMTTLGAAWRISPQFNLTSGYYHLVDNTNVGNSANQFAIGLDYHLSKRSMVYVETASVANHGNNMNLSPVYGNAVQAGVTTNAWMMGLRHTF